MGHLTLLNVNSGKNLIKADSEFKFPITIHHKFTIKPLFLERFGMSGGIEYLFIYLKDRFGPIDTKF